MKVLILNSGIGKRMGKLTKDIPKCMIWLDANETILSKQLKILNKVGLNSIVMTTGPYHDVQSKYINSLSLDMDVSLVKNDKYAETNYIYSIYLARNYLDDDILLLHGDLVFEERVLNKLLESAVSGIAVSYSSPLPDKDFKAVVKNNRVVAVGVEFFESAVAAQPMYLLRKKEWKIWLEKIKSFCECGKTSCYAENALNQISNQIHLYPIDMENLLCQEVDKEEDLKQVQSKLREMK